MRWLVVILLVLAIVPTWSGLSTLEPLPAGAAIRARAAAIPPEARRAGALTLIGAATLESDAPAFGGFSAIAIRHGRITILSDAGDWASFGLSHARIVAPRTGALRHGPGTGWLKEDRDSESLALDAATGTAWVGYERANQIWRYAPGLSRAERHAAPPAMRDWRPNGGAETLVRLAPGRFLAIAETTRWPGHGRHTRAALLFTGDPADPATRTAPLGYLPPPGTSPSDAALLPDGDLVVLNRRWRPPLRFETLVARVPAAQLRPGAIMRPRVIATLAPPLLGENAEGVAVTRERGETMLWIVTDNDQMRWRRTWLMKFQLERNGGGNPSAPPRLVAP